MEKPLVLGVDIGGSHITAALVDLQTGKIIGESYIRRFVNAGDDAETILATWTAVINESFESKQITEKRLCMAMPGPFDYENGICRIQEQDKFKSLYNLNIRAELSGRMDIRPSDILFINDAAAFLKGEVFARHLKVSQNVLGITLGTGLGSALYINGFAEDAALWKSAFRDGIAENYLSGTWFVQRYKQLSGVESEGVADLLVRSGEDSQAAQLFGEFGTNLGDFLVPLINQYKLEIIIMGGNISRAFSSFATELKSVLSSNQLSTAIIISELQENAALIGAASCLPVPW